MTGRRAAEIRQTIDAAPAVTSRPDAPRWRGSTGRSTSRAGWSSRLQPAAPDIAPDARRAAPDARLDATPARRRTAAAATLRTPHSLAQDARREPPGATALIDRLQAEPAAASTRRSCPTSPARTRVTGKSTTVMIGGTAAGFGGASAPAGRATATSSASRRASGCHRALYLPCKLEPHRSRRADRCWPATTSTTRSRPTWTTCPTGPASEAVTGRATADDDVDPRERLTEGVTRERLKMEARRAARPDWSFVAGIVVDARRSSRFLIANISQTFGRETYEVRFEVDNAFGDLRGLRRRALPRRARRHDHEDRAPRHQLVLAGRDPRRSTGPSTATPAPRSGRSRRSTTSTSTSSIPGHAAGGRGRARPAAARVADRRPASRVPEVLDALDADARRERLPAARPARQRHGRRRRAAAARVRRARRRSSSRPATLTRQIAAARARQPSG